jgi:hypothetical protein
MDSARNYTASRYLLKAFFAIGLVFVPRVKRVGGDDEGGRLWLVTQFVTARERRGEQIGHTQPWPGSNRPEHLRWGCVELFLIRPY